MDRRRFFELLGMGVAGIALEQAIPFNRVWSFPKKLIVPATLVPGDKFVMASTLLVNEVDYTAFESAAYWYRDEHGHHWYWINSDLKPVRVTEDCPIGTAIYPPKRTPWVSTADSDSQSL